MRPLTRAATATALVTPVVALPLLLAGAGNATDHNEPVIDGHTVTFVIPQQPVDAVWWVHVGTKHEPPQSPLATYHVDNAVAGQVLTVSIPADYCGPAQADVKHGGDSLKTATFYSAITGTVTGGSCATIKTTPPSTAPSTTTTPPSTTMTPPPTATAPPTTPSEANTSTAAPVVLGSSTTAGGGHVPSTTTPATQVLGESKTRSPQNLPFTGPRHVGAMVASALVAIGCGAGMTMLARRGRRSTG